MPVCLPNLANLPIPSNELEASDSGHQLSLIRKEQGEIPVKNAIVVILFMLRDTFNVSRNMTDDQIITCAEIIMKDYYFLNFSDLKLFYQKAISGKYGKVYERLDPPTVIEWVEKYTQERQNQIEQERINQNQQSKKLGTISPENLAELRKIADAFEAKYNQKTAEYARFRADYILNENKE